MTGPVATSHPSHPANPMPAGLQRWAALVHSAPVGCVVLDGKLRVQFANRAAHGLCGGSPEIAPGCVFAAVLPGVTDQPRLLDLLTHAAAGEPPGDPIHLQHSCPQGGKQVIVCEASCVEDLLPGERAILLWLRDQTREQQLEEGMREAESRVQSILSSSVDAIVLIDDRGRIKSFNLAAERLFGYAQDELVGENVRLLMPSPYSEEHDTYLGNYLRTRKRKVIGIGREVTGRRKDGTLFPMDLSVSEIHWCGRLHFLGTVRDVTQQKRAEEALRNSEARVRGIVDTAVDAIVTIDAKGIVKSINPAAQRMFGYSAHEVIGENVSMLMPDPYRSQHDQYLRNYLATGQRRVIGIGREVLGVRKNGQVFPMELSISEVVQGERPMFTGIVRNVSDRKRNEERLLGHTRSVEVARARLEAQAKQLADQAQRLQEAQERSHQANRAKSEFLANMSHEIRTPMTAVLGYAEILAEDLQDPQHRSMAEAMLRNGRHLLCIIDDILDLSKIEAGRMMLDRSICNPRQILEDVGALLFPRCTEKGIALGLDTAADVPERIVSDPTRIRQVLFNLIGNAIKFTNQGSVHASLAMVDSAGLPMLRFTVTDTGIGMTKEQIALLFQPFSQADVSTTKRFGGTGLGLAISQRLAKMLGGEITLSSQIDQGSCFTFLLPADSAPDTAPRADAPSLGAVHRESATQLTGKRILVVDDGADNRLLIQRLLQAAGAEVTVVEDGPSAVRHLLPSGGTQCPFDTVLMDVQMPGMDGLDTTRALRSMGYSAPIVAVTANAMSGDREQCIEAGCNDYVSKPIDRRTLIGVIAKWSAQAALPTR